MTKNASPKQKFEQVKTLIQKKKYTEARSVLETINHPKASEWLANLDKIAPQEKSKKKKIELVKPKKRGRRWVLWGVGAFTALFLCSLMGQAIGIVPTPEERNATRTAAQSEVDQIAQAATNTVLTPTDTHTETPSSIDILQPTLNPNSPQAQNATAFNRLRFDNIPGVISVGSTTAQAIDNNSWFVYAEVQIQSGLNPVDIAEAIRQSAFEQLETNTMEFSVILDDGQVAADYMWDNRANDWMITFITTNTSSPAEQQFNEDEYIGILSDGLLTLAPNRDIQTIKVADGRANGGERVIIIAYQTIETTEADFLNETINLFRAIGSVISVNDLDVDAISLVAGAQNDNLIGILVVAYDDLMSFHADEISQPVFIERLIITTF